MTAMVHQSLRQPWLTRCPGLMSHRMKTTTCLLYIRTTIGRSYTDMRSLTHQTKSSLNLPPASDICCCHGYCQLLQCPQLAISCIPDELYCGTIQHVVQIFKCRVACLCCVHPTTVSTPVAAMSLLHSVSSSARNGLVLPV